MQQKSLVVAAAKTAEAIAPFRTRKFDLRRIVNDQDAPDLRAPQCGLLSMWLHDCVRCYRLAVEEAIERRQIRVRPRKIRETLFGRPSHSLRQLDESRLAPTVAEPCGAIELPTDVGHLLFVRALHGGRIAVTEPRGKWGGTVIFAA